LRVRVSAPAKVNLFLHVNGKRDDGYHLLDSVVVFPQGIEDRITIEDASQFTFAAVGEFQKDFTAADLSSASTSGNLAVQAAYAYAKVAKVRLSCSLILEKNIPLGAGLGGGSADAAGTIRALEQFYGIPLEEGLRNGLLLKLGADVPVCYTMRSSRFQGIGEKITPVKLLPIFIVLAWPKKMSLTKNVFARFGGEYKSPVAMPAAFANQNALIDFLKTQSNDLTDAAEHLAPEIKTARDLMAGQSGCLLARMTGSGACVFGLFTDHALASAAQSAIRAAQPSWWVRNGEI